MGHDYYVIKGIPLEKGSPIPARQEISAWFNNDSNKYQVSLFMRALTKFKAIDITKTESFFQIAGIHSYPLVGWDGEPAAPPPAPNQEPGYCNHNKITFPTWHRPYMLLFEQRLWEIMGEILTDLKPSAEELPKWEKARAEFRFPYWDWARKQNDVFCTPKVCNDETVSIVEPGGKMKPYPNPLIRFVNPTGVAMGDESMGPNKIPDNKGVSKGQTPLPWSKCIGTSRYGIFNGVDPTTWINGVNNYKQADAAINRPPWYKQGGTQSFAEAVGRLLDQNYLKSWKEFSSTKHNDAGSNKNYLSIEYIHNIVHNAAGGQFMQASYADGKPPQDIGLGHMSDVPVAAFDPLFWLHHNNIDRLAAIWQTFHWNSFFDNHVDGDPTPESPLTPFHKDKEGHFWDSNDCRSWWKLNYQFDDLVGIENNLQADGSPSSAFVGNLREKITKLYPTTSQVLESEPEYLLEDDKFNDYIINVIYDRYALDGRAYSILFFLGEPPQSLNGYRQLGTYLGQVYTFSSPTAACSNCASQKDEAVLSKAQIPITVPLLTLASEHASVGVSASGYSAQSPLSAYGVPASDIGPLNPDAIEEVLVQGLQWMFVDIGGAIMESGDFPNTDIKVLHGKGRKLTSLRASAGYGGYKVLQRVAAPPEQGFMGRRLDIIQDDVDDDE